MKPKVQAREYFYIYIYIESFQLSLQKCNFYKQCYLETLVHNRVEILVALQAFEFVGIILHFGDRQKSLSFFLSLFMRCINTTEGTDISFQVYDCIC